MRTRHRVRWWSRRERLLGGGNISLCLMACPVASVVEFSSSLTPPTVLEGSSVHRTDGMELLHTSIVALLRSTTSYGLDEQGGLTGRGRAILQPPHIGQACSRASVDRNDDFCIFALPFYHEIK